jgi:hypothetical protein
MKIVEALARLWRTGDLDLRQRDSSVKVNQIVRQMLKNFQTLDW